MGSVSGGVGDDGSGLFGPMSRFPLTLFFYHHCSGPKGHFLLDTLSFFSSPFFSIFHGFWVILLVMVLDFFTSEWNIGVVFLPSWA